MNTTETTSERQELEELLPWHAAGTLSRRDAQRVEQALARDPELARRFELVREEFSETILLNESLGAPSSRAADKLFAAIEAEAGPVRQQARRVSFAEWVADRLAALSPRTLAYSAIGAALALALQLGLLTTMFVANRDGGGAFQTASRHPATDLGAGSFVLISFAPEATVADVTSFLEGNKLTLVDGPRPGGLYRVRVALTALPRGEVTEIATRLRQSSPIVRFVAPTE